MTIDKDGELFQKVKVQEGNFLRKKDSYEYTTPTNVYDIELYFNQDGTCYAIGVPRDGERFIVYGTSVVANAERALSQLLLKIERQGFDRGFESEVD